MAAAQTKQRGEVVTSACRPCGASRPWLNGDRALPGRVPERGSANPRPRVRRRRTLGSRSGSLSAVRIHGHRWQCAGAPRNGERHRRGGLRRALQQCRGLRGTDRLTGHLPRPGQSRRPDAGMAGGRTFSGSPGDPGGGGVHPAVPDARPEANLPEPICWTREILARLRPTGRPIHILPESLHERARGLLAAGTSGRPNPSTGFLVTLALLLDRPSDADPIQAFGFGFDGWPGHPWAAERAWFERAEAAGRLRLHPVEG